ncbi:MAG: DUF896 domain-containing protein [Lachnospiraceae bacterium]
MDRKDLDRINELYRKSKDIGLTEEEKVEQRQLREAYVKAVHNNLRGTLENISIKNPDGTITDLKDIRKKGIQG